MVTACISKGFLDYHYHFKHSRKVIKMGKFKRKHNYPFKLLGRLKVNAGLTATYVRFPPIFLMIEDWLNLRNF